MMNFVLKASNFVSKTRKSVFKMMNFAGDLSKCHPSGGDLRALSISVAICIEIDEFYIKNDEFCIKNGDFDANIKGIGLGDDGIISLAHSWVATLVCIKNSDVCIQTDECCI